MTIKYYPIAIVGQYGNPNTTLVCSRDQHGVWRAPSGAYMPAPDPEAIGEEVSANEAYDAYNKLMESMPEPMDNSGLIAWVVGALAFAAVACAIVALFMPKGA